MAVVDEICELRVEMNANEMEIRTGGIKEVSGARVEHLVDS